MSTLDLGKVKQLWRGTWSTSSAYAANDVVAYNGAVWICTQSHSTGLSTEFSPGKRDRTNVLPKTINPEEVNTINVTVATVGASNFFFLDGVQTQALALNTNVRYRFYQKDSSNLLHRFAFSSTPDGPYGGGAEYTTGVTYTGTAGIDGQIDVILPSGAPSILYYYSANDTNYGAGSLGRFTLTAGWRGWQYWDLVTTGFTFKGSYSTATQYYYNDIVEYQGSTYISLADNINKQPTSPMNNHFWLLMAPGDRRPDHNSIGWLANHGPIDWPYPHGSTSTPNSYASAFWISRTGRVISHGAGNNGSHGNSYPTGQIQRNNAHEIVFNHVEWWQSRDNGGTGRMTTPDGQPPKCIQIEQGADWAYALFNNGELWAWGSYGNGARGDQDTTASVGMPRRVQGLQDIKIIKVSSSIGDITGNPARHVLALDDQGFVYTWGQNDVGQLGQGDTQNRFQAARIPRAYFNGEKIIDVLAIGGNTLGSSYVRTAQDNIWCWGYNTNGQLGQANTNNYYRPTKLLSWAPATYSGIRKWQAANWGANGGSFQILDGLGYMWMCGDDSTQHSGTGLTGGNRTTITRALNSVTPNGTITNFWTVWAQGSSNKMSFFRTSGGQTYVSGIGGGGSYYVNGLSASVAQITTPTIVPAASGVINIKEVWLQKQGAISTVTFLRDDGRVYNQGYNGYGLVGNPYTGTSNNTVDDTGATSYPVQMFLPPTTKIVQILPGGSLYSSQDRVHSFIYLTEAGQLFAIGMNRPPSGARNILEGSFVTPSVYIGEGGAVNTPHLMMQGK